MIGGPSHAGSRSLPDLTERRWRPGVTQGDLEHALKLSRSDRGFWTARVSGKLRPVQIDPLPPGGWGTVRVVHVPGARDRERHTPRSPEDSVQLAQMIDCSSEYASRL